MKKIIITLGIVFLFVPAFANAQVDSKCFTKDQCVKARTDFGSSHPNEGFYEKPECGKVPVGSVNGTPGESMGFCLPASETVTQIKFGGKQNFENIGEFLKYIYKYGVMVAGILATVMIIVAGFQWVASGGNSATIGEAKKRIFGAIIGLVLAVGSYTILETINPALVEFRLPQVWLINKVGLGAQYCNLVENPVALALPKDEKTKLIKLQDDASADLTPDARAIFDKNINIEEQRLNQIKLDNLSKIKTTGYNIFSKETECGSEYFMQESGSLTCQGAICKDKDKVCVPFDTNAGNAALIGIHKVNTKITQSACWKGALVIHYKVDPSLWEKLKGNVSEDLVTLEQSENGDDRWLEDPTSGSGDSAGQMTVRIYPICAAKVTKDNFFEATPKFETLKSSNSFYEYILQFEESDFFNAEKECPDSSSATGFMIMNQVNVNWSALDGYIFVTGNNQTAHADTWCNGQVSLQANQIPKDSVIGDTKKNLFLELTLTQNLINQVNKGEGWIYKDPIREVPGDECK